MAKPFIIEVMLKQVEAEVEVEAMKDAKGTLVVSEEASTQTLETIEEQYASNVAKTVNTCNHLNFISYNILNSHNSPLMTKSPTPTPPKSHTPSSEHTPSLKHYQNLSMGLVISSL